MPTFNIYVPSYKRSNNILTNNYLEYCTYVVRKSEEEKYKKAGVKTLAVEDDLINSVNKVSNWILDNTEEDVIAIIDDDVKEIDYRLDEIEKLTNKETITREIERIAQLLYDLNIGYASCSSSSNIKFYNEPFKFVGVNGGFKVFNKKCLKSRFKEDLKFLSDIDLQLNELLKNRIILMPFYFCFQCGIDTNEGGSNENKSLRDFDVENDVVKMRWGIYYQKASGGNAGSIKVKR